MKTDLVLDDLLQNIADFTEDAILITEAEPFDLPGPRIVWCNKSFTQMTGYTLEEIIGKSPRILQGPNPDRTELDRLRKALERWETCRVELENFRKDGTSFFVEFIVRPVADSTGFYRYWISVQRDTTNRRRRETLLETTQGMLDGAPIGLGMLGPDLNLNYANAQLTRLIYPESLPPLAPLPLRTWLIKAFEGSFALAPDAARDKAESIVQGLSNPPNWIELAFGDRWYMFRTAQLQDGAYLLIADDVTQRHKLRSELDFAMRLESMGQLAGGVAHDFNNLLAVILGNLEIARVEDDKRARDECIDDAIASILTSREIIRQLLTFARRAPANRDKINVGQFLQHFEKIAAVACPDSVDMSISSSADDAAILVDRSQLETALLNLVLNAIDAMDGQGRLKVTAKRSSLARSINTHDAAQSPPAILFEVTDTGRGIPKEHVARVVEPFFSTKDEQQGTGLGLAMVHGFASQAGGTLQILSKIGSGTTVKLSLPALVREEIPAPGGAATSRRLPEGLRVLIVEDDPGIRRILRLFLRDLNWVVAEAESGDAAAARLQNGERYDLLVTDLSMPGKLQGDGLVVLASQIDPALKAIIITGNPDYMKDENDILHYLLKPLRRVEFLEALESLLS